METSGSSGICLLKQFSKIVNEKFFFFFGTGSLIGRLNSRFPVRLTGVSLIVFMHKDIN